MYILLIMEASWAHPLSCDVYSSLSLGMDYLVEGNITE